MIRSPITILAAALGLALPATGQIDPQENIKKILEEISTEMSEIDRLLLESGRKDQGAAMREAAEKIGKLLENSQGSQAKVAQKIDQLIEELEKMSQSQSSSSESGSGEPSQRGQQGEGDIQDQQRSQRDEIQQSEFQRQQQQQQQQQQEQNRPQGDPKGPEQTDEKGTNLQGDKPQEQGEERVDRDRESARWGELQKYAPFLQSRGGLPDVPVKYRRLLEAYLRKSHKGQGR